jgi:hypothetical protein
MCPGKPEKSSKVSHTSSRYLSRQRSLGNCRHLGVKFFGPFKQKVRAIQLNNWVKHFVHGTKEPKVSVPTAKATRWNMLTALQETLKGCQPAATATGEFMRKSFKGNIRPAANASHVLFPTVKTPMMRIRQCYETQRPDKKDERFYVYPLFTLKGQTPDIVLENRDSDKPTPRYLPRAVKELALAKLPEYKDLLREKTQAPSTGGQTMERTRIRSATTPTRSPFLMKKT